MTQDNAQTSSFHSGFAAIIGRPNVGKSTLMNHIVGEKVAIVSPKPQTTRNRIMGIANRPNAQIILVDTPGIHHSKTKLGEIMNQSVQNALSGLEALIIMVDATDIRNADETIIEQHISTSTPAFLLLNKIDLVHPQKLLEIIQRFSKFSFRAIIPVSAKTGDGIDAFMDALIQVLPVGPKYFPDDMMTDQPERIICAEIIREKALLKLQDEIPHGIGIEILGINEISDRLAEIHATIYCDRDSHKRIIIGKQGQMLKAIGTMARTDIEKLLGVHVHLELWVKVRPGWRNNQNDLKTLGYINE